MATTASANTSKRWKVRTESRVGPMQQTELFGDERHCALVDIPAWQDLPTATQGVLTSLMARLILDHAEACRAGSVAEAGHDL